MQPKSFHPDLLKTFEVGSGGFVKYVDHMGSDESLVKVARKSTERGFVSWEPYVRCKKCDHCYLIDGHPQDPSLYLVQSPHGGFFTCNEHTPCNHEKVEKFPRGDIGILMHMMENRHTSPIEFAEVIFDLRIPMDIWRQVIRHRTANVSEYSTRYSEAIDEMATTRPDEWRLQATANRQGSLGLLPVEVGEKLSADEHNFQQDARAVYQHRLSLGVAKEQARKDLPLSNYTEAFWKMDLHNLFHFLGLRLEEHAQKEARDFGKAIAEIVKALFPRMYECFEEHKLFAVTFSRTQMKVLRELVLSVDNGIAFMDPLRVQGHQYYGDEKKTERARFLAKLGIKE